MLRTWLAACLLAAVLAVDAMCQSPRKIVVRASELKTGKPIKGRSVMLDLGTGPPLKVFGELEAKTDGEGRATFEIADQRATLVAVHLDFRDNYEQCSASPFLRLEDVVQTGIRPDLGGCGRNNTKPKLEVKAKPGEIVMFAWHMSFWDNLRTWPR
jgi:hypothetical protein